MNQLDDYTFAKKARVEIIPLIDVVFFLLATFVLFTLSLTKISSLDVLLPRTGDPRPEELTVHIQALDAGMFYWKKGTAAQPELISAAEIRPRLEDYRRSVPEPRVLVTSDTKAKFGDAVMVLDEVRRAGIKQVSVETRVSSAGR